MSVPERASGLPRWVLLPAIVLLLLQWLALAAWGLPATHDGFWHLNWIESANHTLWREGAWPRWYAEAWGGAGNPSFSYYPPLLRWLSLPFGWIAGPASLPLRAAIGVLILGQLLFAHAFLRRLPLGAPLHAVLLACALLQPYWLVNLWIRGAWPEALAMLALWPLADSLIAALRDDAGRAFTRSSLAVALLLLAHYPQALLLAVAGSAAGLLLLALAGPRRTLPLAAGVLAGAAMAAASLLPALFDQDAIRLATGDHLLAGQWPVGDPASASFARGFAPLWGWLAALALGAAAALRRAGAARPLLAALLLMLLVTLLFSSPASAPLYELLPPLGRIQFPWRWLGPAGTLALLLLALLAAERAAWRNRVLWMALLGLPTSLLPLRELDFPQQAQQRLDALFACERAAADCSALAADGDLAEAVGPLRSAAQHPSHRGPWLDGQGRVWRYEVYDYMPRGILVESWQRAPRSGVAMPPFLRLAGLRAEPDMALRVLGERRGGQRWVIDIRLASAATLTLERLRFRGTELRVRPLHGGDWSTPQPDPGTPFHRLQLPAGEYRLLWRYVGTPAERAGAPIGSVAACGWLATLLWLRVRARRRR